MPRYAAVDIGSNSVRMMAAEVAEGRTRILAEDREVTRLGESVFRNGAISREALTYLCATLARMHAAYSKLDVVGVRAVATSAVRDARNQGEFLRRTRAALHTDVEVISGAEEARLIHLGVDARWPRPRERTLIVDVGGGSAELIASEGKQLIDSVSKPLGAVRLTEVFLKNDPPAADELHRLHAYIDEKLRSFHKKHGSENFERVIATSATAAAIVCAANRVPRSKRDQADRLRAGIGQVRALYSTLSERPLSRRRRIAGIGPRRAEIIIAGTAVFLRALEMFGRRGLYYSAAGVRDGIIADLAARRVGREFSQLSAEQRGVVQHLARHYGVSLRHASHVAHIGHRLFDALQPVHRLPAEAGKLLEASAYLHDIGHYVSSTAHHKHSGYLVANSDLPGFTDKERLTIAALCRFHRKSMPQARHSSFQSLEPASQRLVTNLAPILRIADALDRGQDGRVQDVHAMRRNGSLLIFVDADRSADLEIWAANEAAKTFQDTFATSISVQRTRARKADARS